MCKLVLFVATAFQISAAQATPLSSVGFRGIIRECYFSKGVGNKGDIFRVKFNPDKFVVVGRDGNSSTTPNTATCAILPTSARQNSNFAYYECGNTGEYRQYLLVQKTLLAGANQGFIKVQNRGEGFDSSLFICVPPKD